jgi:hypothetical protein
MLTWSQHSRNSKSNVGMFCSVKMIVIAIFAAYCGPYLNTAAAFAALAAAAAFAATSSAASANLAADDDADDLPPRNEERPRPAPGADCDGMGGSGKCS